MAFPVTLNGRTYTLADFSGTNYVAGFPDALEDFVTQAGNIYTTTSTSSVAIGTGSKTFTVADSGKPYTVGTPLRIADAAAPATNWIDGIVTSYSGTTLVVNAVAYAGSGTIASWNINIGGGPIAYTGTLPIAQGGTGATAAADARANLGLGSAATSAATDFVSQTAATGSAIVPTGTDAQRDGTPSAGFFRFNTDSSSFEGYDGASWGAIGGSVDLSAVDQDILPDADSTRDIGSTSARWAQGWFDDVTLTNLNGNPIATAGSLSNRNKIINGAMQVAQRGTNFAGGTTNADDAYTLDRWYVLSEGSDSIDVDQVADSPDTGGKCIRLDVETTGEKFGIAQIVEASNCTGLIGNTVTLSFAAKVSNARIDTVKAAVVAWSGTADTVTSDIVSAWNADGTTPTLIANATFENTPADLGVTTSWATYEITANVDTASTANLIVFIWSDDATNPLAGDFLYLTNLQLEAGDTATPFEHRSYGQELALCQRYAYVLRGEASVNPLVGAGWWNSSTDHRTVCVFPTTMRVTPTLFFSSLSDLEALEVGISWNAITAIATSGESNRYLATTFATSSGGTTADFTALRVNNAGFIGFSAEL